MAFLTFRQSDQTVTDAQKQQQHVILGVPLTMYHVDANFKAINDELVAYKQKYGLGITRGDQQLTIAQIFGSNDTNAIGSSGFYKLTASANSPAGINNSVVIHAQSADGEINDVTAIQLTAGVSGNGGQVLYYRTKQGQNTWNSWQSFASAGDVDITVDGLREAIEQCVKKTGDTMTGQLTLNNKLRLTGNNEMFSATARKGVVPSSNITEGFHVYDNSGIANEASKLGFFGLKQSTDGSSGLAIIANNPVATGSSQSAEIFVGWKQDADGNYVPTTRVPSPTDSDENQIATTGWVTNEITQIIVENNTFSTDGGIINGDVIIESDLTVNGGTTFKTASFTDNVYFQDPANAVIAIEKGQNPSAEQQALGNGYLITDNAASSDPENTNLHVGGQLWGQVDYQGNFTTEIAAINWNKAASENDITKAAISVTISKDGSTISTSAPTPSSDANGSQIATTEWVRKTAQDLIDQNLTIYDDDHPWDMGVL